MPLRTAKPNIQQGSPESFGWQRRPDLDTPAGLAYETPDGKLMLFRRDGPKPAIVRLTNPAPLSENSAL